MTALELVPGRFAVARLGAEAPVPPWAAGTFVSITRTADELSIVCAEDWIPAEVRAERGWACLRVTGAIPFETTGVAAALTAPLAAAGISVFLVATFDTDYLLVKKDRLKEACQALRGAGLDLGSCDDARQD